MVSGNKSPPIISVSIKWRQVFSFMIRPLALSPGKEPHDSHWIGGWVNQQR